MWLFVLLLVCTPEIVKAMWAKVLASTGKSFKLIAEVPEFERSSKVGFEVRSVEGDEVTTTVYEDAEKKVIIDCSNSSSADCSPFSDYETKTPRSGATAACMTC